MLQKRREDYYLKIFICLLLDGFEKKVENLATKNKMFLLEERSVSLFFHLYTLYRLVNREHELTSV